MQDLSRELDDLRQKQAALDQGLRVALLIERLNRSLEAALVARQAGAALPQEAQRFHDGLSELSRALPTDIVRKRLARLADEVQAGFAHILAVTRLVRGAGEPVSGGEDIPDVGGFLRGFVRQVQSYAGFRVLLYRRGERVAGLVLDIPTGVLQQRLQTIATLQTHCRVKIAREIRQLRADTYRLLLGPGLTETMKATLRAAHQDLQAMLTHLEGGGDLSEIAERFQSVGLDSQPMSSAELAELLRAEEVEEIPLEHIEIQAPEEVRAAPGVPFRDTLRVWLNTPVEVSWNQVRSWQERKRGNR